MAKILVAYFSVSGVTEQAAEELAKAECADLFRICPETPYTKENLDWTNKESRSTLEMKDLSCRPPIYGKVENMSEYDVIFVGFPIWWGREPSVVDTFLEAHDLKGKYIVPFCTSGGSGIGNTAERIRELTGANVAEGKRLGGTILAEDLKLWTDGLGL